MSKWFAANNLVLYLDKAEMMKFITKNLVHSTLHNGYKEKYIEERVITKFLLLQIDYQINCKNHILQIIPNNVLVKSFLHNTYNNSCNYYNYSTKQHVSALFGHHQAYKTLVLVKVHSVP